MQSAGSTRTEERPWGTLLRGNPMNANSLSSRLRDFNVKPTTVRIGEVSLKGYKFEDFAEAFERNLPAWVDPVTTVTSVTSEAEPAPSVTPVTDVTANTTPQAGVLLIERAVSQQLSRSKMGFREPPDSPGFTLDIF